MGAEHIDTRLPEEPTERSQDLHSDTHRITRGARTGPAAAEAASKNDITALETAAALENLLVSLYRSAVALPFVKNGPKTVAEFFDTSAQHHQAHAKAFNEAAAKAGGQAQTQPDETYEAVVTRTLPSVRTPADVVRLALHLEDAAARTHTRNVTRVADTKLRRLFASVAPVEAQHRATLLAVQSLLASGHESLIEIPTDAPRLPAAIGSATIPEVFQPIANARPMSEGAIK
ncbi:ferritin-like domain-containing protein [Streptomyces lushanensis]|uniref:ferritin-like domain-containing protein n=1 Tax=Streptomyces lushanensis TaxID=1434255 RepID=UPI0009A07617|nr:ferritin-like domain-containing protein [Streptomyces lushanensis]